MIIVDYSQLCIASFMVAVGKHTNQEIEIELIRHMILQSIRKINSKFRDEYGELVLAIDANRSWRKDFFPYYKSERATTRSKSDVDWNALFLAIKTVKEEIIEIFPYKVIEITGAEADDVIGVLSRKCVEKGEKCLIVSGDKDFIQLQVDNDLVKQWDKINDKWVSDIYPKKYLFEHVLKGDRGDGIPNILSAGDSFATKTRQNRLTQKKIDGLWEDPSQLKEYERFYQNLKLIDLNMTPKGIKQEIINTYENYKINDRRQLFKYFVDKGLRKLTQSIGEF